MAHEAERSDETLVREVAEGSMDSFRILYERYRTRIFNFAYHLLADRAAAEDCAQDVFLRLHANAARYRPDGRFSSWLYRIARNAAMDAHRRRRVRRAASVDAPVSADSAAALKDLLASSEAGPDRVAESKEIAGLLRRAVLSLEAEDRQLVYLCDMEGLPHAEVAAITGLSTGHVAVKLHRAHKKLAERLRL
jgi:RNA polymerase sigma-70 factor, ECF subfamily